MWIELDVKCRKCPACLRKRRAHWSLRAQAEHSYSQRTWFGTLTVEPARRFRYLSAARLRSTKNGVDFDQLDAPEQFSELLRPFRRKSDGECLTYGEALTLFIKRVRKNSGATIRYMMVTEAHQSGDPHFHILLHESIGSNPVRHRVLKEAWKDGFSDFKLVTDAGQLQYVAKYLGKSSLNRLRASVNYGKALPDNIISHHDLLS